MSHVQIKGLHKSFGATEVLHDIWLDVVQGEFVVLVGPSGCGKSTLLRTIAGLEATSTGSITIGGRTVNDLPPAQREIAMVFQSYALYPHLNVFNNMAFGLKFAKVPKAEIDRRVSEAARMLRLEDLLLRKPRELSGGQRQRVAIGRAIVREPQVFLFDEPLSNLDAALRVNTRIELARLHKLLKATMIYVTHDQVEAMTLADKIVVLNKGRIAQQGKPMDLYYRPDNLFVASFIGSPAMNMLPAHVAEQGKVVINGVEITLQVPQSLQADDKFTLGIRPEHVTLGGTGGPRLAGTVDLIERLGETGYAHVDLANGGRIVAEVRGEPAVEKGSNCHITLHPAHIHIFDKHGMAVRAAGRNK
jgi:ABC-type sugar transport system ATPase subunit